VLIRFVLGNLTDRLDLNGSRYVMNLAGSSFVAFTLSNVILLVLIKNTENSVFFVLTNLLGRNLRKFGN